MNRTIKFRAWDIFEKTMDYEVFLDPDGRVAGFNLLGCYVRGFSDSEVKLMQFTGLYDRNGKEIFEDDIVEIKNHPFDGSIGIDGMYRVGYSDRMEICCGSWLLHHVLPYATVVGNMYQHPHLLGGTEDE
ncbi:YopX family protein [Paenibacillus larvae]|uniref:YopX family protein n=1 Tax=Paenibacillus larvae TaxID=1464 RepID=UPI00227DBB15|nr:YopX family protein [Paenibacillus larvae]MCY9690582.1 YopX family protein [Paenibacillus larvae]